MIELNEKAVEVSTKRVERCSVQRKFTTLKHTNTTMYVNQNATTRPAILSIHTNEIQSWSVNDHGRSFTFLRTIAAAVAEVEEVVS